MFHVLTVSWKRGEVQIWRKTTKQKIQLFSGRSGITIVGTPVPNLNTRSFPTQEWQSQSSKPQESAFQKTPEKNLPSPQHLKFKWHTGDFFHRQLSIQCQFQSHQISPQLSAANMGESFPHFVCHSYSFVRVCWKGLFVDQFWVCVFLVFLRGLNLRWRKTASESQNLPITSCVNPGVAVQEEFQTTDSVAIWVKP